MTRAGGEPVLGWDAELFEGEEGIVEWGDGVDAEFGGAAVHVAVDSAVFPDHDVSPKAALAAPAVTHAMISFNSGNSVHSFS
eukprot:CAMPEP_0196190320 /NCGR_PEP_ID=MMETSP0911-20130528/46100_1 /TAXON_ID=49265 /ORGANISM="Thalassiosira rotula, Strain GSO102" /LENGTH=81 /DNA_ID=CAMNT_0041462133 /DNA_START=63 /DNA_END=309 /DNA_ORIENTATION=+